MTDQPTPETDAIFRDNVPDDAQIAALLFCERLERERNAARAERDEHIARNNGSLLALHLTTAERDEARAERDALRADVARLRNALEGMLIAEMEARQMDGFGADEVEAEPHWMAARAALAAPAQ
jgi:hypothetical protein